jgi:3-oxoacyl-[acyl-carrier protein] reductase
MAQEQKVALMTCGALNIGRQIALHPACDGYRVMTTARTSKADARETARLVREAGSDADTYMADIADQTQVAALVDATVGRFGRLDVLINNASVRRQTKFAETTPAE